MRIPLAAAALAAFILTSTAGAARAADGDDHTSHIQFLAGIRQLNDNDWKPADEQTGFGVQFDVNPNEWPFHFAVGFKASESDSEETDVATLGRVTSESKTGELNLGIRKYLEADRWRPFLGVGLSVVRAELDTTTPLGNSSDSGTGVGPWAGIGVLYMVSDWLGLGGQVQYSQAEVELFGEDLDAGGVSADVLLSLGF